MHKNLKFIVNAESLKVLFSLERFKKASQKQRIIEQISVILWVLGSDCCAAG
jgi:hypothetical protein